LIQLVEVITKFLISIVNIKEASLKMDDIIVDYEYPWEWLTFTGEI